MTHVCLMLRSKGTVLHSTSAIGTISLSPSYSFSASRRTQASVASFLVVQREQMLGLVLIDLVVHKKIGGQGLLHDDGHALLIFMLKNLSLASGRTANLPKNLSLGSDPVRS